MKARSTFYLGVLVWEGLFWGLESLCGRTRLGVWDPDVAWGVWQLRVRNRTGLPWDLGVLMATGSALRLGILP